ncbi:MAG: hypothetical protein LBQ66_05800 [Planctomycetaceae bacterium]|jgi:predicted ATPase|nr:hypothetical protein [Planctomycetaceae bacterium]
MPSNHNPFSTCNWLPGKIEYIFESGIDLSKLAERLMEVGKIAQIAGQHGTGKSTLLESLSKYLNQRDINVQKITLNNENKKLHTKFQPPSAKNKTDTVYILDGFEQLSLLAKIRLRFLKWHNCGGLIFTTHKPVKFVPILYQTVPNQNIFENIVANLIKESNFTIEKDNVKKIFQYTKGNFRNAFFMLYDLYEESELDAQQMT